MPKLYFRFGCVGSAKTMNLLAAATQYDLQKKRILLVKPAIDTRFGTDVVQSRTGLSRKADYVISKAVELDTVLTLVTRTDEKLESKCVFCVFVDEVQFFSAACIDMFRKISMFVPVICYGLKTDSNQQLWEGSKRLLEIADVLEEVKTTCAKCNKKAICSLKHRSGKKIIAGQAKKEETIEMGTEELYVPTCWFHFETWEM